MQPKSTPPSCILIGRTVHVVNEFRSSLSIVSVIDIEVLDLHSPPNEYTKFRPSVLEIMQSDVEHLASFKRGKSVHVSLWMSYFSQREVPSYGFTWPPATITRPSCLDKEQPKAERAQFIDDLNEIRPSTVTERTLLNTL